MRQNYLERMILSCMLLLITPWLAAQLNFQKKYENSMVHAGIEVGSKGVKLSVVELGEDAKNTGAFNILKDTSINTDFISFTPPSFDATLNGLTQLYSIALERYGITPAKVFTVVSSGVKGQAEKENRIDWIDRLIDSFRIRVNEPAKQVEVVDVRAEARLSHLGIIPRSKRFSTFLIDIGSGNTKGGYFPFEDDPENFKLFQFGWGTKSTANAAEKKCEEYDKTLANFNRQLYRVLLSAENSELNYAVNSSGAYNMNDYIAFSGGIAWATATLLQPDQVDNSVITVSFEDVQRLNELVFSNYASLSDSAIVSRLGKTKEEKERIAKEVRRVHGVFDQRSLLAGTGLLLKIMRQFKSVYESKGFYLLKNGHVGWVTAYVGEMN